MLPSVNCRTTKPLFITSLFFCQAGCILDYETGLRGPHCLTICIYLKWPLDPNIVPVVNVSASSFQNGKKVGSSDFVVWKKPDHPSPPAPMTGGHRLWHFLESTANPEVRFLCVHLWLNFFDLIYCYVLIPSLSGVLFLRPQSSR